MGCPVSKELNIKKKELEADDDCFTQRRAIITDQKVTQKYHIKSLLGYGTFSSVFFAEEKETRFPYAIKWIALRNVISYENFVAEKKALERIKHPNIVYFHDVIISSNDAYLVMELATGGDLFEEIQSNGHLPETESCRISKMLVSALSYLHKIGITHRDVKAENVLYYSPGFNSRIIVTDFGLASLRGRDTTLETFCGTPEYLSPELLLKKKYTSNVDIWALGCLVYFMLCGKLPFYGNLASLTEKVVNKEASYDGEIWKKISNEARNFIRRCLQKDPKKRASSEELLYNIWFTTSSQPIPENPRNKSRRLSYSGRFSSDLSNFDKVTKLPKSVGEQNVSIRDENVCNNSVANSTDFNKINKGDFPTIINKNEVKRNNLIQVTSEKVDTENPLRNNQTLPSQPMTTTSSITRTNNHINSSLLSRRRAMNDESLIVPKYSKRITKEELFRMSPLNDTCSITSRGSHVTLSNVSNASTYDPDSPTEFVDACMEEDTRSKKEPSFFPPLFRRSISNQHIIDRNLDSLFTVENVKRYNQNCKAESNLDALFTVGYTKNNTNPINREICTMPNSQWQLPSSPPQKLCSANHDKDRLSNWLEDAQKLIGVPSKVNSNDSKMCTTIPFRKSNMKSNALAKSF